MKIPRRLVEDNELIARLVADASRREPPPRALEQLLRTLNAQPALAAEPAGAFRRQGLWVAVAGAGCLALLCTITLWPKDGSPPVSPPGPVTAMAEEVASPPSPRAEAIPSVSIDDLPDSKPVTASPRASAPQPPSKPSVRRELELIARARGALTRGDARACLAALDVHDREFSTGQFELEASVMRIEATLASGDRAGAGALARSYLAKHPGSPYEERVRSLAQATEDR